jgi:uncharacterized protein
MANPFVHIELNTDDDAKAKKFYQKLFDWEWAETKSPGGSYHMIKTGPAGAGGGVQKKPMPEAPTAWLPYVQVDDVKKAIAKARKLGAQIVVDYTEIGAMGSLGVFVDPTGAALGVWAPAFRKEPAKAKPKAVAKKAKAVAKPKRRAPKR